MLVLTTHKFSDDVWKVFTRSGHVSCDLLESQFLGRCRREYVRDITCGGWNQVVVYPSCTHLTANGTRQPRGRGRTQADALDFVPELMSSHIRRIVVENPISVISSHMYDQIIRHWQSGNGDTRVACLWHKNRPPLKPTNVVGERVARIHREPPSPDNWKARSQMFEGTARTLAVQWECHHLASSALTFGR